jgi:histidinol-phosphate phosphatase family protein
VVRRAVFLDRDGTIAKDVHYCRCVDDFVLLPGAAQAIRLLNEGGFMAVVITNQSGIGRGYFSEETLSQIHRKMVAELGKQGAQVDAIYHCPHHPDDNCLCRKPRPAMLLKAAQEMGIALGLSYMIGDHLNDVEAGRSAGCRTVWLAPLSNQEPDLPRHQLPDHIAESLPEAATWLLSDALSRPAQEIGSP